MKVGYYLIKLIKNHKIGAFKKKKKRMLEGLTEGSWTWTSRGGRVRVGVGMIGRKLT